jgi:hypothetical protein
MERGKNTHTNKQMNKQNKNKQLMHGAATDQLTEPNFLFTSPWWSKMNKQRPVTTGLCRKYVQNSTNSVTLL